MPKSYVAAIWLLGAISVPSAGQAQQPVFPVEEPLVAHTCARVTPEVAGDAATSKTDLVGALAPAGIASATDDTFIYVQLHLADDPRAGGSCDADGFLAEGWWAALIDADGDRQTYEVALFVSDDGIQVYANSDHTLRNTALDPHDSVATGSYALCTHSDVHELEDGTYALILAVAREDVLAAANTVLNPDLPSLTGDYAVWGVTSAGGATLSDQACFDNVEDSALCEAGEACPPLEGTSSWPLIVDTFVDVQISESAPFGSTTPTINGLTEPGASVEISDGEHAGMAVVEADGRFHFDVPSEWEWSKGDSITLEVTATDPELHSETEVVHTAVGNFEVDLEPGGLIGFLDKLLPTLHGTTTLMLLPGAVEIVADIGGDETVDVCSGVVLAGTFACAPDLDEWFGEVSGTLIATVTSGNGSTASDTASFAVERLVLFHDSPSVTADPSPTFLGETNAPDDSPVEVRIDGTLACTTVTSGGLYSCTPDEDVLPEEGEYELDIRVESATTGMVATLLDTIRLDLLDPVLTVLGPLDGSITASGELELSGTVLDLGLHPSVRVRIEGDSEGVVFEEEVEVLNGAFHLNLSDLEDDTYTIEVEALDLAGNNVDVEIELIVDSNAIFVVITAPSSGAILDTTTPLFEGSTDASEGSSVDVHLDPETQLCATTVQADLTWACESSIALADGPHSATVIVDDGASTPGSATVAFHTDTTPPTLEVEDPSPNGCTLGASFRVGGKVEDTTTTTVEVSLVDRDGGVGFGPVTASLVGSAFSANLVGVEPGTWTVRVRAADAAGHESTDISQRIRVAEAAAPLDVQTPGAWSATTTPTVSGSTQACPGSALRVHTKISGVDIELCSTEVQEDGIFACDVGDGLLMSGTTYDLELSLNDGVHPIRHTQRTVTIDTEAPAVRITAPMAGAVLESRTFTFAGEVEDSQGEAHVFLYIWRTDTNTSLLEGAEAEVNDGLWTLDVSGIAIDAEYRVRVVARDEAGNEATDGPVPFRGPGDTGGKTGGNNGGNNGSDGGAGDGGGANTGGDTGSPAGIRSGSSVFGCSAGGDAPPSAALGLALLALLQRTTRRRRRRNHGVEERES